jgi:hypothetical protein
MSGLFPLATGTFQTRSVKRLSDPLSDRLILWPARMSRGAHKAFAGWLPQGSFQLFQANLLSDLLASRSIQAIILGEAISTRSD